MKGSSALADNMFHILTSPEPHILISSNSHPQNLISPHRYLMM